MKLRQYQEDLIDMARNSFKLNKRIVLSAPTGAGKTVMFTYIVTEAVRRNKKILIITHRLELLKQTGGTFDKFNLETEFIQAGKDFDKSKRVHIGMIETINSRIDKLKDFLNDKELVIIDECHLQNFNKLFKFISNNTYVLGVTATPHREKNQECLSKFYTDLVQKIDVPDLIKLGYLSNVKSYGVEINMKELKLSGLDYDTENYYTKNRLWEGVIKNYELHAKGKKTIIFTNSVNSSTQLVYEINKYYEAKHIDGSTPYNERQAILEWYDNTPNAILSNCGVLTAGFDQPDIGCVIMYRATSSLTLFLQMVGRGSRVTDDKKDFVLLDFGNNIQRFGFWQQPRKWELIKKKKKTKQGIAPIKICPKCGYINHMRVVNCEHCGFVFEKQLKENREVELKELMYRNIKGRKVSELDLHELIYLQDNYTLKASYVWRIVRARGKKITKEYAKMKGYSTYWLHMQDFNDVIFKDKIM